MIVVNNYGYEIVFIYFIQIIVHLHVNLFDAVFTSI